MITLRVFEVPPTPPGVALPPKPIERTSLAVDAEGDAAKAAAKEALKAAGWVVRSINWAPGATSREPAYLLAYVTKGA